MTAPVRRPTAEHAIHDLHARVRALEATPDLRTGIWGALFNDANIIEGTGFTATWDNNGGAPASSNYYTIYFDDPFTNPPVVLLTPNNNNPPTTQGIYGASLLTRLAAYIVVVTYNFDGSAGDGGFDFLALEPRV